MVRKKILISKSKLEYLYIKKNLTPLAIGVLLKLSFKTVRNRLKEHGIPFKDPALARMRYKKFNFSGDLKEKAYMIGFRLGDFNVYSPSKLSQTIVVRCHTTQKEQVVLMRNMFKRYGRVGISRNKDHFHVNCFLDKSFNFLLDKNDNAWQWVKDNDDHALAFICGYTDAEGNFIINQGKARFKIDSYDYSILNWMYDWLVKHKINAKFRRIYIQGDVWKGKFPLNKDLWRLNINDKVSLNTFISSILPILHHQIRIRGAKNCLRNIQKRNEYKTH